MRTSKEARAKRVAKEVLKGKERRGRKRKSTIIEADKIRVGARVGASIHQYYRRYDQAYQAQDRQQHYYPLQRRPNIGREEWEPKCIRHSTNVCGEARNLVGLKMLSLYGLLLYLCRHPNSASWRYYSTMDLATALASAIVFRLDHAPKCTNCAHSSGRLRYWSLSCIFTTALCNAYATTLSSYLILPSWLSSE